MPEHPVDRPVAAAPTSANLADWLTQAAPATLGPLAELRAEIRAVATNRVTNTEQHAMLNSTYTLLSEVFFWPVCVPALESGDAQAIAAVAAVVEQLLMTPDRVLSEAVLTRVVEPLIGEPAFWEAMAPHAGSNLRWAAEHH